MDPILQVIIAILGSFLASSGLWACVLKAQEHRYKKSEEESRKEDAMQQMLKGLGHDRIMELGTAYIERGSISKDEYENLNDYLYKPYKLLHGNGSADRIMREIEKLPIHS